MKPDRVEIGVFHDEAEPNGLASEGAHIGARLPGNYTLDLVA